MRQRFLALEMDSDDDQDADASSVDGGEFAPLTPAPAASLLEGGEGKAPTMDASSAATSAPPANQAGVRDLVRAVLHGEYEAHADSLSSLLADTTARLQREADAITAAAASAVEYVHSSTTTLEGKFRLELDAVLQRTDAMGQQVQSVFARTEVLYQSSCQHMAALRVQQTSMAEVQQEVHTVRDDTRACTELLEMAARRIERLERKVAQLGIATPASARGARTPPAASPGPFIQAPPTTAHDWAASLGVGGLPPRTPATNPALRPLTSASGAPSHT
jgi:hypothetical protein